MSARPMSIACVAVALCFGGQALAVEKQLDGEAIAKLLGGATSTGLTATGSDFEVSYSPDGRLTGQVNSGRNRDSGTWEVDGDTMCSTWSKWRNSRRACFRIYDRGDGNFESVRVGDGRVTKFRIRR